MQEYDLVQFANLPVIGNRIEYVAITQADGALRVGSDLLNVVADGQLIGNLRPGEAMSLNKKYSRWQLTCANYAKVRIGMGQGDYIAARGITTVESAYRTLRGIEYELAVKAAADPAFSFCGFRNESADKLMLVTRLVGSTAATLDASICIATVAASTDGAEIPMNKHGDIVEAPWIQPIYGKTAAWVPTALEMTIHGEVNYYGVNIGTRNNSGLTGSGSPFAVPPGKSILVRCMTANNVTSMSATVTALQYGPR